MISEKDIRELVETGIKELNLKEIGGNTAVSAAEAPSAQECPDDGDFLPDLGVRELSEWSEIPNPEDPEGLARLKSTTPARLGIWRAGTRFKVDPWLRFKIDLASAKDAVLKR